MESSSYECAYCGGIEATTDDHIPPKSFFVDPHKINLPTVKACRKCHNKGTSLDDECFRDVILKYHIVSEKPQVRPLLDKMFRAATLPKKRKYAESILRSFTEAEVTTFSGLILGKRPAFKFDRKRIERAAIRYIKGLHRYVFNERVPDDAEVRVVINPEAMWEQKSKVIDAFRSGKIQVIQDKIFAFKFGRIIENPKAGGC